MKQIIVQIILYILLVQVFSYTIIAQTPLPETIEIQMSALRLNGESRDLPCNKNGKPSQAYGCTAIEGNEAYTYPFDTSTITIGYENHMHQGSQQGYLHNVVPQEIGISIASLGNKPLSAVQAQTIAARTYAYYHC